MKFVVIITFVVLIALGSVMFGCELHLGLLAEAEPVPIGVCILDASLYP